jgi:hypothetical protein
MAPQSYLCLWPLQGNNLDAHQGDLITLDDQSPGTLQLLAAKTIILAADPHAPALLAEVRAAVEQAKLGPGFAGNLEADQAQTDFGDAQGQEHNREMYNSERP